MVKTAPLKGTVFVYICCFKRKTVKQQRKHKSFRVKTHLALSTVIILTLQARRGKHPAECKPPPSSPFLYRLSQEFEGKFYTSCGFSPAPPNCRLELHLAEERSRHYYQSRRSPQLQSRALIDEKRGGKKTADLSVPSIQTFAVTLPTPSTGLKLTEWDQLNWEWRNVDQILFLACPRICSLSGGITAAERAF
ncbi:hypothetical protein GOODEAATRI_009340 [Goodea atripinnis]|uniref:HAT C-terminal dimerisation domain-containing protein n=1 Tax=Goodea atripinnis TaxID=208336 RepID=A0ABV0MGF9_9TELE